MRTNLTCSRRRLPVNWIPVALLLAGLVLRLYNFTADRFHADEALYAGWALRILDGDLFLLQVPVDKPPLYLYLLAGSMRLFGRSEVAARLPNVAASLLGLALLYRLGRRLYGPRAARWALFFAVCSPFDILFARTAFTDPLLVAWTLAAMCAAAEGRWVGSGLAMGLALATKQHAVLLAPLVPAVGALQARCVTALPWRRFGAAAAGAALGLALPCAGILWWDALRWAIRPGYWQQSALSYGGLVPAPAAAWGARLAEWSGWARYLAGTWPLYLLLLAGSLLLCGWGWWRRRADPYTRLDTLFAGYALGYLAAHTVFQFSIWDRYLLPLAPLAALLLARLVTAVQEHTDVVARSAATKRSPTIVDGRRVPCFHPKTTRSEHPQMRAEFDCRTNGASEDAPSSTLLDWINDGRSLVSKLVPLLFVGLALAGGLRGATNGYPVGGEHWAYQGLDQVVAYLKRHAAPDAVLYHHWLHWHYSYYLHGTTYELRWWESGAHLQREARRTTGREQYIVLPDWRTLEPDAAGLRFELVYQAYRQDGSPSLGLYRIQVIQPERVPVKVLQAKPNESKIKV